MTVPTIFETCSPRADVLEGAITEADFAADLAQVIIGTGNPAYLDPARFFADTYLTQIVRSPRWRRLSLYSAQLITRYCALSNLCRRAALNLCGIQVIPCVEKHDDKASFGMIHATTLAGDRPVAELLVVFES